MTVRKKRSPVKPKRPVITKGPDSADIMDEYLRNLYATACAKARNEIAQKMEEAEKLISEGEKIDVRKLLNDINEEIILREMIEKAMEDSGTNGAPGPKADKSYRHRSGSWPEAFDGSERRLQVARDMQFSQAPYCYRTGHRNP